MKKLILLCPLVAIMQISCSAIVNKQYVESLSDRTLCDRWSGIGPGIVLYDEIQSELSNRRLNCANLGFTVSKEAIRQSNEAIMKASADRERARRLGTILFQAGEVLQQSSSSGITNNPTSDVRLLRRRINSPDVNDPTIIVYCEYSDGRIVPYYNNAFIQCPTTP